MRKSKYTDQELRVAVKNSTQINQVLEKLGLSVNGGGSYSTIRFRINRLKLDTSHMLGRAWLTGKSHPGRIPFKEILIENSTYQNVPRLKARLIKEGIFQACCQICSRKTWNKKPIPLQLHHINGNNRDHREENIQLLCPNCHAQTNTYCGKNITNNGTSAPT